MARNVFSLTSTGPGICNLEWVIIDWITVAIIDTGQIVTIDTPKALIKKLLDSGFEVEEKLQNATLEDVFINLTGKSLREN